MRAAVIAMLALAGCVSASAPPPGVVAQLAPAGMLRTGHLVANPILVARDARSGKLSGVTVDLAEAMARDAGVALRPVACESLAAAFQGVARGEIDVLFLANDPTRAGEVAFAATYMEVTVTYLVPFDSPIRAVADADVAEVRIAVGEKNAADLYLTRKLKSAQLLRVPYGVDRLAEAITSSRADAVAGNVPELVQVARLVPRTRLVEGQITAIHHAVAVPPGRPDALRFVRDFVERAKASGLVDEAIARSGAVGVRPAR